MIVWCWGRIKNGSLKDLHWEKRNPVFAWTKGRAAAAGTQWRSSVGGTGPSARSLPSDLRSWTLGLALWWRFLGICQLLGNSALLTPEGNALCSSRQSLPESLPVPLVWVWGSSRWEAAGAVVGRDRLLRRAREVASGATPKRAERSPRVWWWGEWGAGRDLSEETFPQWHQAAA